MAETVLVLVPGSGVLAMPPEELHAALSRGREILGAGSVATPASEPKEGTSRAVGELLSAAQMAERTSVPASWWESAARNGTVPCIRLGRWTRFDFLEVIAAAKTGRIARLAKVAETPLPPARRLRVSK